MKLTFVASATTIIEHKNTKILTDPWVIGKPFFGSWAHYPPVEPRLNELNSVDYIYISHVHQDHADEETLKAISDDIPIIIYDFDSQGLKKRLESYGKKVITLKHGEEFHCGDGLKICIYIADDCNPEICKKHFGCGKMESKYRASTIDTMAVFDSGTKTILNINDCPYELAKTTLDRIKKKYNKIDFLLTCYCGASAYPQCYENYTDKEKLGFRNIQYKTMMLLTGGNFINHIKPDYYMPFAGTFTLAGKASKLQKFKAVHTVEYALDYFQKNYEGNGILLNSWESFDLDAETQSAPYEPTNYEERDRYIEDVLSKIKYTYEYDESPTLEQIADLLPAAYLRFENKRKELLFSTETQVYIYCPDNKVIQLSVNGGGYKVIDEDKMEKENYLSYRLDHRLLYMILKGPRYAHWNQCEGGNHIMFSRKPDIYQRGLSYCMNYFHS
jgi:UDP-MurNAc hydroxylase